MTSPVKVSRFTANLFPVNAYLVETPSAVIAVDATLGVSDARALRARVDALGKPLAGVIVTHSHPDHYGGVGTLVGDLNVPIVAVEGVDRIIRRDDPHKEEILRPMFGDEWAHVRRFPDRLVRGGERVTLGEATFQVIDAGPSESPHDSWWILEGGSPPTAFVGDLVYSHMHAYLADGFYESWLGNLERARRELPPGAVLSMGHGDPTADHGILEWQAAYIRRFLETLRREAFERGAEGDALVDRVTAEMKRYLPTDDLLFLLQLSIPVVQAQIGATRS